MDSCIHNRAQNSHCTEWQLTMSGSTFGHYGTSGPTCMPQQPKFNDFGWESAEDPPTAFHTWCAAWAIYAARAPNWTPSHTPVPRTAGKTPSQTPNGAMFRPRCSPDGRHLKIHAPRSNRAPRTQIFHQEARTSGTPARSGVVCDTK